MNDLIKTASKVWLCVFSVENIPNIGEAVVVKWTRPNAFREYELYHVNYLPADDRREAMILNTNDITKAAVLVKAANVWQTLAIDGQLQNNFNYTAGLTAPVGTGFNNPDFLVPSNQNLRGYFNINRDQGGIQFTISRPNNTGIFYLTEPGPYTINDQVTSITMNNNFPLESHYFLKIEFKTDTYSLTARKTGATTEAIITDRPFNPGLDTTITCVGNPAATTINNAYGFNVQMRDMTFGQVGWIPFDPDAAGTIAIGTALQFIDTQSWHSATRQETDYTGQLLGGAMTGSRLGTITGLTSAQTTGQLVNITFASLVPATPITINSGATSMPNTRSIELNRGTNLIKQYQHIEINNHLIESAAPTMFSIAFKLTNNLDVTNTLYGGITQYFYNLASGGTYTSSVVGQTATFSTDDDTAKSLYDFKINLIGSGAGTNYARSTANSANGFDIWLTDPEGVWPTPAPDHTATLDLNTWVLTRSDAVTYTPGTPGPFAQVQTAMKMIQVVQNTGFIYITQYNKIIDRITPLKDGTGAALVMNYDRDYYLSIAANDTNIFAFITDKTNGDKFWATLGTTGAARLPDLERIGAAFASTIAATDDSYRFDGSIYDFRLFQKNAVTTLEDWKSIHDGIANYTLGLNAVPRSVEWFMNYDVVNNVFNAASYGNGFTDWGVLNQPTVWTPNGAVWTKSDSVVPSQRNWYQYVDINCATTRNLDNTARTSDAVRVGDTENLLKIHTDTGDNVLVIGESPSVELLEEKIFVGGSPAVISTEYTDVVGSGGKLIIAEMTGEEVQNQDGSTIEHVYNVEIDNLPQRTYQGGSHTSSKSVYEIPLNNANLRTEGDNELVGFIPPTKIWHPLNNGGPIPLNHIEVKITDDIGREVTNLRGPTHVNLEIKTREEII